MKLKVWDLPTRLFHWILVASVGFLIYSGKTGELFDWHQTAGIVVLALILYRLIWGFVGSSTARFSDFLYSPAKIFAYAKNLFSRKAEPHAGHNPVGGLMVVVMLGLLLFQGITGLFSTDDILVEGKLYDLVDSDTADWMTGMHHTSSEFLIPVLVLHILAIVFYRIWKKHDLLKPMITGSAEFTEAPKKSPVMKSAIIGLVIMALSYAALYFGLDLF
ncbi:cytochrome B [Leucothrix sargassi]|nr:cytochrome B [Leucothrix sargassi]